jgi:hypothetical protein
MQATLPYALTPAPPAERATITLALLILSFFWIAILLILAYAARQGFYVFIQDPLFLLPLLFPASFLTAAPFVRRGIKPAILLAIIPVILNIFLFTGIFFLVLFLVRVDFTLFFFLMLTVLLAADILLFFLLTLLARSLRPTCAESFSLPPAPYRSSNA